MIKLSTSYSKKIPVEGQEYSSQSFHASVELELSDSLTPEQIKERIHETAALLRRSVDDELSGADGAGKQSPPASGGGRSPVFGGAGDQSRGGGAERKASNRQIKYITDLAAERNITLADLNTDILYRFGAENLYQLTSRQASALLDGLKAGRSNQRAA